MLTLQQLLENDSIAAIVAKINQNFQTLALTNGGPQGIRGPQGIPGLPGKLGPIGPTGEAGPTGSILGLIPFSAVGVTAANIGPSVDTLNPFGSIGPWPSSSYEWLSAYYSNGYNSGQGQTPKAGDVFVDHGNNGYWKFLDGIDQPGASTPPGYTQGGAYSFQGNTIYPDLGAGAGYCGPGWYFYPVDVAASAGGGGSNTNNVWVEDKTTYLVGNLNGGVGPYTGGAAYSQNPSPLTIANARLLSKYGTVWITSGNDQALAVNTEPNNTTSTIQDWGDGPGGNLIKQPGRNNSGIDRLLFKMSIDGLPYKTNIKARGWSDPMGDNLGFNTYDDIDTRTTTQSGLITDWNKYFIKPAYDVSLSDFTPLLFFSERKTVGQGSDNGRFSSLGYYLYTSTATVKSVLPGEPNPYGAGATPDNNVSKSLHLFSSRYSPDPIKEFPNSFTGLNSGNTFNYGEFLLDFRKVVASNQYICSVPSDLKISGDTRIGTGNFQTYDTTGSTFRYQVGQGYVSSINGRVITGQDGVADYWEYGLGSSNTQGALTGFHDNASGIDGMVNRNVWYGTSVMKSPSDWDNDGVDDTQQYRIAGMLERGRKITSSATRSGSGSLRTHFLSELVFYTSQFNTSGTVVGATAGSLPGNGLEGNTHNSKPSFYVSPYGNIGIGTFVGAGTSNDEYGPIEPGARLQVHVKKRDADYDPTWTYETITPSGLISNFPQHVFGVAAFTGEKEGSISTPSHAADVYFGFATTSTSDFITPSSNVINEYGISKGAPVNTSKGKKLRTALRAESWYSQHLSSMRFGVSPYVTDQTIGRNGADLFSKEFIFSLSPINAVSSAASTSVSGVGIHNLFPRTRFHLFGKNINNEIEWGMETTLPSIASLGTVLTSTSIFPFYSNPNTASTKQVSIDYLENTYKYPVGLYEYQYEVFGNTSLPWPSFQPLNTTFTNPLSANSSAYPNREKLGITRSISYSTSPYQWGNFSLGTSIAGAISANRAANNSWRHGGESNGMYEPSSYLGFNLIRDLSSATGTGITNTLGDNSDSTRWLIGTQGSGGAGNRGNNGAAAFMFSPHGELGLVTIPRGNDGGLAYEQWEQRGLGTRDILNQMKIVFDQNGNIAIGNGAGWDLDAYPSLERFSGGELAYVPKYTSPTSNAMTLSATTFDASLGLTAGYYFGSSLGKYGYLKYTANNANYTENSTVSSASQINARNTKPEYIRLEVAAEKAWSRNGRSLQRLGWGYPINATIKITTPADLQRYIAFPASWNLPADLSGVEWTLTTDAEGRLKTSALSRNSTFPNSTRSDWKVIIYPHPREFNQGSPLQNTITPATNYTAPPGAIAAEWAGMNDTPGDLAFGTIDTLSIMLIQSNLINLYFSVDERGSANVRLNNFVYGEGWGADGTTPGGVPVPGNASDYTINKVIEKRQESPKLIFSFLEKTPDTARTNSGLMPYRKVNTVLMSAQNESALREFYIPKADNTGGTLMVFTDQFIKTKDQVGTFADGNIIMQPTNSSTLAGLYLEEVITQEFLGGYKNPLGDNNSYVEASIGVPMIVNLINPPPNQRAADPLLETENVDIPATGGFAAYTFLAGPKNLFPGFVRYFNSSRLQTTQKGKTTNFSAGQYGKVVSSFSGYGSLNPTNPAATVANNYSIAQRNSTREPDYTCISIQKVAQGPTRLNIVNDSRVPAILNIPMAGKVVKRDVGAANIYAVSVAPVQWSNLENSAWCNVNPVDTKWNGLDMGDYTNISTAQPSPALFGIGGYGGDLSTTINWKTLPGSSGDMAGKRGMGYVSPATENVVIQTTIRFGEKNMLLKNPDTNILYWPGLSGGGYESSAPPFTGWVLQLFLREDDANSPLNQGQAANILATADPIPVVVNFNQINTWDPVPTSSNTALDTRRPFGFTLEKNDPITLRWTGVATAGKRYWVMARLEYTGYSQGVPEWLPNVIGPWDAVSGAGADPNYPGPAGYMSLGFFKSGTGFFSPDLSDLIDGAGNFKDGPINLQLQLSHFAMNVTAVESNTTSYDRFNRFLPDPGPVAAAFMSGWYPEGSTPTENWLLADCRLNGNQQPGTISTNWTDAYGANADGNNVWRWVYTDDSQFLPHYQMFQGSLIHSGYGNQGQSYFKVFDNLKWNLGMMSGSVDKRNSTPSHMKITGNISIVTRGTYLDNNSNTQRTSDYSNRSVPRIALRWLPDRVGGIYSNAGTMFNPFKMFQALKPDSNVLRGTSGLTTSTFGLFSPYVSDIAVHQKTTAAITGLLHPDLGWDYSKEIAFITGKKSELVDYRRDLWRFPKLPFKRWSTSTVNEYGLVWQVFTTDVVYEGEVEWLIPWDLWTGAALNNPSDRTGGLADDGLGWNLCCALTKSKATGIGIVSGGGLHYNPIARASGNNYSGSSDSVRPDVPAAQAGAPDSWGSNDNSIKCDVYRMDFKFEEVGLHATKQLSTPLAILNKADKGVFGYPLGALKGTHTTYYNSPYIGDTARSQATIPEEPHNNASLHRNIDYYYKLVNGNSTVSGLTDNKKSAIRLRRINEEYALIDYNITVEVQNPEITNNTYLQYTPWCLRRIDFGGPRWTQYLRFIYTPDNDGNDDTQYNNWGSNWWLSNWSTYKQWYPGSAVVGGEEMSRTLYSPEDVLKTVTGDGSPFYQDWTGTEKMQVRTWNGNMLDLLSSFGYAYTPPTVNNPTTTTVGSTLGSRMLVWEDNSIFRGNSVYSQLENPFFGFDSGGTLTNDWTDMNNPDKINRANLTGTNGSITNSGVFSAFAADRRMIGYAAKIFNAAYWKAYNNGAPFPAVGPSNIDNSVTEAANQQTSFMKFLGASYSLWGNLSYMRNKNTQWRITPVRSTNSSDMTVGSSNKSNSFLLEVQLSDPILHVTTPFGDNVFGSGSYWNYPSGSRHDVQTVTPYKYLTLSGQAIIRFEETTVPTNNSNYIAQF